MKTRKMKTFHKKRNFNTQIIAHSIAQDLARKIMSDPEKLSALVGVFTSCFPEPRHEPAENE